MSALFLTRDPTLLEELTRLAAAAGVDPVVSSDPVAALASWARAPLVLVGADLASEAAAAHVPRRRAVHLVGWSGVGGEVLRSALALGAESVAELPTAEDWLVETLTDVGEEPLMGRTIGVIGGAGGAGATTLACALGQVGAQAGPTLVVDTDPLGAGADRVLGLELADGIRWDALEQTTGRLGSRSLREAVPCRGRLGVLSWAGGPTGHLEPGVVREALSAARRGHDLVVLDLARHGGDLVEELATRCDRVVVVTAATLPALASTVRLVARLTAVGCSPCLAVRRGGVGLADVERAAGARVVVEVPTQRGLAEAIDLGLGPVRSHRVPLARAARTVLAAV